MDGKIGDKVVIRNNKYKDLPEQLTGFIDSKFNYGYGTSYGVHVTGCRNPKSETGNFYFYDKDIRIVDRTSEYPKTWLGTNPYGILDPKLVVNAIYGKTIFKNEENIMKEKQLIKGYKVAKVEFSDCTVNVVNYALYDESVTEGDYVLCATANHGQVIGKVIYIEPNETDAVVKNGREIICKIDYSAYNDRQNRINKLSKLKERMEQKRKELNELAVYKALAADCPEMAEMLKEFNELS